VTSGSCKPTLRAEDTPPRRHQHGERRSDDRCWCDHEAVREQVVEIERADIERIADQLANGAR